MSIVLRFYDVSVDVTIAISKENVFGFRPQACRFTLKMVTTIDVTYSPFFERLLTEFPHELS
jgi:hypothetical protein